MVIFHRVDSLLILENSPIPSAAEKIAKYRQRYTRLTSSIQHYETRVEEQNAQLNRMNRQRDYGSEYGGEEDAEADEEPVEDYPFTEEDMRREEEEVKELERKKRGLEERVSNMEKDISGVSGVLR
jgi:predicted  nucleic acid-binding Zn-ribbon protein